MTKKLTDILKPEVKEFIKGHLHDDPFSLSLHAKKIKLEHPHEAILQIQARQKALKKLPSFAENFDIIFPKPISVEQSSSETTAKFKAGLFKGKKFADLTGGMGIDAYFFSPAFEQTSYVESDAKLCELAAHNFAVLNKNIGVVNASAEEFLSARQHFDLVYLDPSRRDESQKKVFRISDCKPNVIELEEQLLQSAEKVLVKLSPLADIKDAFSSFKYLKKIWVVAVKNECRELLCYLNKQSAEPGEIEAINIDGDENAGYFKFSISEEKGAVSTFGPPQQYIYEPNAAILKSGAFKTVGARMNLVKLHSSTHLYTSEKLIDFPGRVFRLNEILKVDKKELAKAFSGMGVNVVTRNFHLKAEEVLKKFRLKSGDDKYAIATTLADNSRAILNCDRVR